MRRSFSQTLANEHLLEELEVFAFDFLMDFNYELITEEIDFAAFWPITTVEIAGLSPMDFSKGIVIGLFAKDFR